MLYEKVFLALALCASFSGFAQVLKVTSVEKVNTPANPMATVAAISPKGDYLLLSTSGNQGLTKFDLNTNQATKSLMLLAQVLMYKFHKMATLLCIAKTLTPQITFARWH